MQYRKKFIALKYKKSVLLSLKNLSAVHTKRVNSKKWSLKIDVFFFTYLWRSFFGCIGTEARLLQKFPHFCIYCSWQIGCSVHTAETWISGNRLLLEATLMSVELLYCYHLCKKKIHKGRKYRVKLPFRYFGFYQLRILLTLVQFDVITAHVHRGALRPLLISPTQSI